MLVVAVWDGAFEAEVPKLSIGYYKELQKVIQKKQDKTPLKEWIWNKDKMRLRRIPDKGNPLFVLYGSGEVKKKGHVLQVKCDCGATNDDAFKLCCELAEGSLQGHSNSRTGTMCATR